MSDATILNVFCDADGKFGNPVAIVEDLNRSIPQASRQKFASRTGFSETVFIENMEQGKIRIYTPQEEIAFAGHAAVGAAHYIGLRLGSPIPSLDGRDGSVVVSTSEDLTWVTTDLASTPPWMIERLSSIQDLEELESPQDASQGYSVLWSWIDEAKGLVRARTFAATWGIPEDEANGSGCMRLACALGRELEVRHGRGSVVHASPSEPGHGKVGGRIAAAGNLTIDN